MAARYVDEDKPSAGNIFPAGPEGSSTVQPSGRRWGAHDFPRPHILEAIETDPQTLQDIAKVWEAWAHLKDYEPHGEILADLLRLACVHANVSYRNQHGWMHRGRPYRVAVDMAGSKDKLWRSLTDAWGLVAVLAVEATTLKAAQEAGAGAS